MHFCSSFLVENPSFQLKTRFARSLADRQAQRDLEVPGISRSALLFPSPPQINKGESLTHLICEIKKPC